MAKQVYKIISFHGGLATGPDARDILDGQLVDATDIMIDNVGKIRTLGSIGAHSQVDANGETGWTGTITPGYGLFYFSHDKTKAEITGLSGADTGDDYLAIFDANDEQIWIYSRAEDNWSAGDTTSANGVLDLGDDSIPVFYIADGTLRIADGSFGNSTKWYGYIERTLFADSTDTVEAIDRWHLTDNNIDAPTIADGTAHSFLGGTCGFETNYDLHPSEGAFDEDSGKSGSATVWPDNTFTNWNGAPSLGDGGVGFMVDVAWHTDFGMTGYLAYYRTNIYDYTQESLPTKMFNQGYDNYWDYDLNWANSRKRYTVFACTGANVGVDQFSGAGVYAFTGGTHTAAGTSTTVMTDSAASFVVDALIGGTIVNLSNGSAGVITDNDATTVTVSALVSYVTVSSIIDFRQNDKYKIYTGANGTGAGVGSWPNKRQTGAKFYWRDVDSNGEAYGEMYLLLEVDLRHGVRKNLTTTWKPWANGTGVERFDDHYGTDIFHAKCGPVEFNTKPRTEIYGARTGYPVNLHSISARYKTAVVANRRTYIGNVQYTDISGNTVTKGDAVLKSPVNAFDVFPATNILEAVVNDGDEIIHLATYGDRLLQFKKHKLEILNISQNVEFLEDTLNQKGVAHPASVCKTDYGIAWANNFGCYLFDGQKVNDLLEKGGIQIISESNWETFLGIDPATRITTQIPMVGYVTNKRQLIVSDDITTNGTGAIFLFDMVTKSWVKGSTATITDAAKTNFVNDWNGNLIFVDSATGQPKVWNDTSVQTTALSLKTKDIDFDQPAIRKKVYRVRISYRGDGDTLTVKYSTDGNSTLYQFNSDDTPLEDKDSAKWYHAELKPTTSSESNNIYSFQLHISGTAEADFEINDISIVYRNKGVK